MYERKYGSNYNEKLSTTEIAKEIRKEIQRRKKSGQLPQGKYSVRTKYFAGGSSIDITVKDLAGIMIFNPKRMELRAKGEHVSYEEDRLVGFYTEEMQAVLDQLKSLMNGFNFDGSETQVDYWDVNFYGHVDIDYGWQNEQSPYGVVKP